MLLDLHTHPVAHGEYSFERNNLKDYIETAIARGCEELGFSDHDIYLEHIKPELVRELQTEYPQIKLRLGLEVDYRPGIDVKHLAGYGFDYLIGSVHEVSGWIFDHPDYLAGYSNWQGDDLYKAYFEQVIHATRSGYFQIMGHLDVIRVFGFKAQSPLLKLALPALEEIRDAGLAIEINTNGKYKPVGDYYPARELLEQAYKFGIPVTLGSDAHQPGIVARDLSAAVEILKSIGYKSLVSFAAKQRLEYPI